MQKTLECRSLSKTRKSATEIQALLHCHDLGEYSLGTRGSQMGVSLEGNASGRERHGAAVLQLLQRGSEASMPLASISCLALRLCQWHSNNVE